MTGWKNGACQSVVHIVSGAHELVNLIESPTAVQGNVNRVRHIFHQAVTMELPVCSIALDEEILPELTGVVKTSRQPNRLGLFKANVDIFSSENVLSICLR